MEFPSTAISQFLDSVGTVPLGPAGGRDRCDPSNGVLEAGATDPEHVDQAHELVTADPGWLG